MSYYPIFLNLDNKKVIVLGGGSVAQRKVMALIDTGAHITVISPELTDKLRKLRDEGRIVHCEKNYETKEDLDGAFVVIAATSDERVNAEAARAAQAGHSLVNVVDAPHLCNFIVPSVVKRAPLTLAISTDSISPAFSRTIRQELEELYGQDISEYLLFVKELRLRAKKEIKDRKKREAFLRDIASPEMLAIVRKQGADAACHKAEELYRAYDKDSMERFF